ncbi:2764_t:CDS:2 [Entrophospora sp. SA101]|nr:2763_t:CDS:2 [Entrophospora sp. SA101]CAJ0862049.1 2764_t:CDS:2 [Entrophospora sp. SA101]
MYPNISVTNWGDIRADFGWPYVSDIDFRLIQDMVNKAYEEYGRRTTINVVDENLYPRAFGKNKDNIVGDTRILLELIRTNTPSKNSAKRKKKLDSSLIAHTPGAVFKCFNIAIGFGRQSKESF